MPVVLVIENGDEVIKSKVGANPILLGRSSKCHLKLSDDQISGKHLSVSINKEGKTLVKDLETTNGTYLNGSKIMEAYLFLGDEIMIGEIRIFLDDSEMGPSEKSKHTRDGERTQHTFINLRVDDKEAIKKAMKKTADERKRKIEELLKSEKKEAKEDAKPGMRTRIINKAKEKVSKESVKKGVGEVRDGENFELEESSGETKMLKIDRPKKGKK